MAMQTVDIKQDRENYSMSEAYKALRTNVQFCGSEVKVIAVTSCQPGEGKSSVSLQLASALAESGKRVLFIDADLRKSAMAKRMRLPKGSKGLSQLLSGMCEPEEAICGTNVRNLQAIFSGPYPPNPAELLGGKRFSSLIARCREIYDYVVIDTAPLGNVIDAAVVAGSADGAVMVLEASRDSRKFAAQVKEQLQKSGCRILGVVLNKVKARTGRYYGHYYGQYGETPAGR